MFEKFFSPGVFPGLWRIQIVEMIFQICSKAYFAADGKSGTMLAAGILNSNQIMHSKYISEIYSIPKSYVSYHRPERGQLAWNRGNRQEKALGC
jgi:hypothetical protein